MTKTLKKVGVPTTISRQFKEGVDSVQVLLNDMELTLVKGNNKYEYNVLEDLNKTNPVSLKYHAKTIVKSKDSIQEIYLDNKSLVNRIEKLENDIIEFTTDTMLVKVSVVNGVKQATCESRYNYVFISNENDFTLEQ